MNLDRFNALAEPAAEAELTRCCGAKVWVRSMVMARPFSDHNAVRRASEAAWSGMTDADWLEAFRHHPRIGEVQSLRQRFAATASWAEREQAGSETASEQTLQDLATANEAYEQRFGYIFIVCATGKSAAAMLAILRQRLPNDPAAELKVAAEEQKKSPTCAWRNCREPSQHARPRHGQRLPRRKFGGFTRPRKPYG